MRAFKSMIYELDKGWCNWVKLGAALLVAVSHYSTVIVINNHWSDSQFLRFWCQGGYVGVALFFFLSGYGLMESEKKYHLDIIPFLKKRFLRVYLPVLMVSIFWIPLYYFFVTKEPVLDWNCSIISTFIYDIFWDFRDPVLWFVKILFLLYGVFCGFAFLRNRGYNFIAHALLIVGTLFATWLAFYNDYPYISVPLFGIGAYSSMLKDKQLVRVPVSIVLIFGLACIFSVYYIITKSVDSAHGVVNCFVTIVTIGGIYMLKILPPPPYQTSVYQQYTLYT